MRYFAVSDNMDTLTGLRMAGIEGVVAHERKEVRDAVSKAIGNPEIGILLITERLASLCSDLIGNLKQCGTRTIVVEIPDRHGTGRSPDSITRYVRESIGIRV